MALIKQDDQGITPNANAYVNYADFQTYHDARGNVYTTFNQQQCEQAIIKATDFLDARFKFIGMKQNRDQTTQWPRINAWDADGRYQTTVPQAIKDACCEYALRQLTNPLMPDPTRDPSGRQIQSKTSKVGPIETSTTFVSGAGFMMPEYPMVDNKLRRQGLILSGRTIVRS